MSTDNASTTTESTEEQRADGTMTAPAQPLRLDGWANLFSGYGTSRDPLNSSQALAEDRMSQQEADNIYRSGGVSAAIVDLPAEEMTRKWIKLMGDDSERIDDELTRLNARVKCKEALTLAGLYGGAFIVMVTDDTDNMEAALDIENVKEINRLMVFDRWQSSWDHASISRDLKAEYFNEPAVLRLTPINGGQSYKIHRSRVLIFDGEPLPPRLRVANDYWGESRLQRVKRAIARYAEGLDSAGAIMRGFVTPVLAMKNLGDLIAAGRETEVRTRLNILGMSQSMLNVLLIDADGETYNKSVSSVAGIRDLLMEVKHNVSASARMPATLIFGASPDGMNATGEGEARNFYDSIAADQVDKIGPQIRRLIEVISVVEGIDAEKVEMEFLPLWQPTEKEAAETMALKTANVATQMDLGLIDENRAMKELYGEEGPDLGTGADDV